MGYAIEQELASLATIEHALKRKRAALRALTARVKGVPGCGKPTPCSDASRLSILRQEVQSLERSKQAELLQLASSSAREYRREARLDAKLDAAMSDYDETMVEPSAAVLAAAELAPPTPKEVPAPSPDPKATWKAHRMAQKARDLAVRSALHDSWREHADEVRAIRQSSVHRVDHRFVYRSASDQGPLHLMVPANELIAAPPAPPPESSRKVVGRRRDAKVLNKELIAQRYAEWDRRGAYLDHVRTQTPKRIDDRLGPEALRPNGSSAAAAPIALMREQLPAAWRELRRAASGVASLEPVDPSAAGLWREHAGGDADGADGAAERMGATWYDFDAGYDDPRFPLYTTAAQVASKRFPHAPDDPYRYAYTTEHAPPPMVGGVPGAMPGVGGGWRHGDGDGDESRSSSARRPRSARPSSSSKRSSVPPPGPAAPAAPATAAAAAPSAMRPAHGPAASFDEMRRRLKLESSQVRTIRRTGNWFVGAPEVW